MNTYTDKNQENKSQSVADAVSINQNGGKSAFQFVDNRPEADAQRKLQEMANNRTQVKLLRENQKGENISSRSKQVVQRQITSKAESDRVDAWVANANNTLSSLSPDSVIDAPPSSAVRLRWFDVKISGISYLVGVNIHYGGAFGALWVKNINTKETNEYHPHANPQHGLNPATLAVLQRHVYEFDTALHYKVTNPVPGDGDWDRQFAGA